MLRTRQSVPGVGPSRRRPVSSRWAYFQGRDLGGQTLDVVWHAGGQVEDATTPSFPQVEARPPEGALQEAEKARTRDRPEEQTRPEAVERAALIVRHLGEQASRLSTIPPDAD